MSVASHKRQRSIFYIWLMRSQPSSPMYDPDKAERIYKRHQATIEMVMMQTNIEKKKKLHWPEDDGVVAHV